MSDLKPIVINGVNPVEIFDEAARIIAIRRGTAEWNRIDQGRHSVAAGLGEQLERPLTVDNLLFTSSGYEAMALSAKQFEQMAQSLRAAVVDAGEPEPKISVVVRGPIEDKIRDVFGPYSYHVLEIEGFQYSDFHDRGEITFRNFEYEMHDAVLPRTMFIYSSPSDEKKPHHFLIGYVDVNPSYPDGHIRGKAETEILAQLFKQHRDRALNYLTGKDEASRLAEVFLVVEYFAWYGLEFGDRKPFSFSQLPGWAEKTHVVYDTSQCGLHIIPAAVLVAPATDITSMRLDVPQDEQERSILACEFMFGANETDRKIREKFLARQASHSAQNAVIATAIINGKARDFLDAAEYSLAKSWLMKYGALEDVEAEKLLDTGLHGFNVVAVPEAGHSLFIDYQGLMHWDDERVLPEQLIDEEFNLPSAVRIVEKIAQEHFGLTLGGREKIGFHASNPVFILPTSVESETMIDILMRLRQLGDIVPFTTPFKRFVAPEPLEPIVFEVSKGKTERFELRTRPDHSLAGITKDFEPS